MRFRCYIDQPLTLEQLRGFPEGSVVLFDHGDGAYAHQKADDGYWWIARFTYGDTMGCAPEELVGSRCLYIPEAGSPS